VPLVFEGFVKHYRGAEHEQERYAKAPEAGYQ
jgi:hypothetical protein